MRRFGFVVLLATGLSYTGAAAAKSLLDLPGEDHCTNTGGVVQTRIPTYGTNGGSGLALDYPQKFCEYTSSDGTTHIDLLIATLIAHQPTLAVLAYYAQVPFNSSACTGGAGPGSCYCTQLGGTDEFGGVNAAGGGWVLSTDNTNVLDACIFPDLSSIDAYGLFYHSAGIIRGRKLNGVLRYKDPY